MAAVLWKASASRDVQEVTVGENLYTIASGVPQVAPKEHRTAIGASAKLTGTGTVTTNTHPEH